MATPRQPVLLRTLLIALVTFALLPIAGAGAEPASTPADARRELAELNERVDDAVESFAEIRLAVAAAQRREAAATARVRRVEKQIDAVDDGLAELARAAYVSGGSDELITLMTADNPQDFLDTATSLDRVARGRKGQMRTLRVLRRKLETERRAAKAVLDTRRSLERKMASTRTAIERQVARQESLVARLETADARRRRMEAARAAAARRPARASREMRATPAYSGPASGRAAIAVREAYRQLGKPYRWGASGPNSFDCSGLTMWVWGKAGVSLPHSSRAQYGYGVHVSKSELRPGDLVFYGSPIHHVGIYVGNGQYIAAPQTGDVVSFRNVNRGGWAGATRL